MDRSSEFRPDPTRVDQPYHDSTRQDHAVPGGTPRRQPCAWVVRLPHASLVCVVHDQLTAPWCPAPGCALPVATVCHVCARTAVPVEHRFSWSFLCRHCTALDVGLARPSGAWAATPHTAQSVLDDATLLGRLFPDRVARWTRTERTTPDGRRLVVTEQVPPPSSDARALLRRFLVAEAGRLAARLTAPGEGPVDVLTNGPAGGALDGPPAGSATRSPERDVPWEKWHAAHVPSPAASAAAYRRFVESTHPWIDSVEPRTADLAWLTALAADGPAGAGS